MNRTPRVQERGSSPAPRERWMSINAPTRHRKASARTCTRQRDRAAHQVRKRSRTRTKINRNIRETTKKRDAERKKANDGDRLQRQNIRCSRHAILMRVSCLSVRFVRQSCAMQVNSGIGVCVSKGFSRSIMLRLGRGKLQRT